MRTRSVFNMALRGLGLALRFVLTFYVAKFLDLNSLGIASILFAGVALAPVALSFGLHYRMNREIVGVPLTTVASKLRDRIALHSMVIGPIAAVIVVMSFSSRSPWAPGLVLAIVVIAALEVVLNDIYLSMLSLDRSVEANTMLFLRASCWVVPFVLVSFLNADYRSIGFMLACWTGGLLLAVGYTFGYALRDLPWADAVRTPTHIAWFGQQRHVSTMIYCSDLAVVGAQYADRAVIAVVLGMKASGIYFFYWSIANGIQQLVNSTVVQVSLPRLVQSLRNSERAFRGAMAANLKAVLLWLGVLCPLGVIAVWGLVRVLGRQEISSYLILFPILLVGVTVRLCSDVLNYGLYAMRRDGWLAGINVLSIVLTLGLNFLVISWLGLW